MDKNTSNSFKVSEFFHSIQGEGSTIGHPAWFLRLTACNLDCIWCDTTEVWKKGKRVLFERLPIEHGYNYDDFISTLKRGDHLIITGGEPLLQEKSIFHYLQGLGAETGIDRGYEPFVEIETNGTIFPKWGSGLVDWWNVSPKLENSGQILKERFKPEVLTWFNKIKHSIFKFVVDDIRDLTEIHRDFIYPEIISKDKIWLMPMASNQQELTDRSIWLAEECRKNGFRFSNRLQVQLWNKVTGV